MMSSVPFKFVGKRVLVTGAGRGIGRAVTKALVAAGAEAFALSRTSKTLQSLVHEIPSVHPIQVDLADWESTRKAVEGIGPVDLLVNNAGVAHPVKSFLEIEKREIDHIFDVNLKGVINVSQVVVKKMISAQIPGSIVNISSMASIRGCPGFSVYGSSKGALDQLTRVMAAELGHHQIRVNSVNPILVWTDMGKELFGDEQKVESMKTLIPLGKFPEKSDVVKPVLFLLSDCASMISGTILFIDGGLGASAYPPPASENT